MLETPILYIAGAVLTVYVAHRKRAPKSLAIFWPATLPFLLFAVIGDWLDPNIR